MDYPALNYTATYYTSLNLFLDKGLLTFNAVCKKNISSLPCLFTTTVGVIICQLVWTERQLKGVADWVGGGCTQHVTLPMVLRQQTAFGTVCFGVFDAG